MIETGLTNPCPFCTSENHEIKTVQFIHGMVDEHVVACLNCGAVGPGVVKNFHQATEAAMQSAIDAWNTRGLCRINPTIERVIGHLMDEVEEGAADKAPEPEEEPEPSPSANEEKPDSELLQGDDRPSSSDGGDEPAPEQPEHDAVMKMRQWMELEDMSPEKTGELVGVSGQTVRNILNGSTPYKCTLEKIEAAFKDYPPETNFIPNDDPELIGNLPMQPTPQQAAAYLQKVVAAWMKAEGLDHSTAAMQLQVKKQKLLNLLQLHLPLANDIEKICRRIPELRPELRALLAARKMLDNQHAAA